MVSPVGSRLAVITGASAGIGQALVRAVAREGRPVLAVARRGDRLEALSAEASASGWAPVHPLPLDLAAPGAPLAVRDRAAALGGAAWLVNNAGFGGYGPVEAADPARLSAMVRLNCEAVVLLTHALLPQLLAGRGFVLNVASVVGFQPTPFMAVYGASKAFVLSFTEGLSEELRGTGAGAGAFCPGPVDTEFQAAAGLSARPSQRRAVMTAEAAAGEALRQLRRRQAVRVPRLAVRVVAAAPRLLPRAMVRWAWGRMNRPRALLAARPGDGRGA
jgi:short-subunit dehydrogenase